ncbi:MAG TPA: glycoside hydrolase family 88 protein [Mucilaginibacter sp.]|nr:glycoside hydrolase family 88 protein [Mucilaginibacter sp.]
MIKYIIYTFTLSLFFTRISAQNLPLSHEKPLTVVKTVADKILRETPFKFQLVLAPSTTQFDFIKFVDFGRTFGLGKPGVAYAISQMESKVDTAFIIQVSHNDGLKIWINGQVVYTKDGARKVNITPRERDIAMDDEFIVKLKKGINSILVKSETRGGEWIFYLQPKGALLEDRKPEGPALTLEGMSQVSPDIAKLTNWLVVGPFDDPESGGSYKGLNRDYGPEAGLEVGRLYDGGTKAITWTIPKIEVFGDVIDSKPYWGTYYNWNYHAGGVAWAMAHLSEATGDQKYDDFSNNWTDFMLNKKAFVGYQVNTLNGFQSIDHQLFNTPLLDFTAAPALPFIYRLVEHKQFKNRKKYEALIKTIKDYVIHQQIRLPEGNFARETPEKYTTWVDDMFMGIPFLVQAALETRDPREKERLLNDAANQILTFDKQLFDPAVNLYQHAQYTQHKEKFPYWSRANGWGIWATTEVLMNLPENHPKRKEIMSYYRKHVDALVKLQNLQTGFWYNVLNRPDSYQELSGTAIFTMAIARGINNGWLERSKYTKTALLGWKAVVSSVDADGTVHNICVGTMTSEDVNYYLNRPKVDDDSHGMIGLIFAGIEMDKLMANALN